MNDFRDPVVVAAIRVLQRRDGVLISDVHIISESATTSSGGNTWGVQVANLTDTLDLRSSDYDTNTDGDFVANTRLSLSLDQNLSVGAIKTLQLQLTKTGTPGNLTNAVAVVEFTLAT